MKELISEIQLKKFKELIKSLGRIEVGSEKKLFSISRDIDSNLRVLLVNENKDNIIGLSMDSKRRIYSQNFFRDNPKLKFIDLINLGKIANYLIEEVLGKDNQIYRDLSNKLKSNSLEWIGNYYPEHRKSLIKFRFEESEDINSLSIGFNKEKREIQLFINPYNYIKIALTEVLILAMKRFPKFEKNISVKEFNKLISIYGSFLLLHELYHVLHRHIFDNYSEQLSLELENMIMDNYINLKLIYLRLNNPEIKDVLKLLSLKYLEINSGIGSTIYLSGYLRKDLIKADKLELFRLISYFRELKPIGYDQMIQYLFNSNEEDKIFIAIQNLDYLEAFDSFSTPIRKFIKEFIDLQREESNIPEEIDSDNRFSSRDSNSEENTSNTIRRIDNKDNKDSNDTKDNKEDNNSKELNKDNSNNLYRDNVNELDKLIGNELGENIKSILEIPDELLNDILAPVAGEIFDKDSLDNIKLDKVVLELLDKLDINDKLDIKVDWRDKLEQMIEESSGVNFIYNPDGQNRRYEGQLGRLELIPAIENIILSFDISGSMTTEDYKIVINYVEDLIRRFNIGEFRIDSSCNLGYVYWAGLFQGNEYVIRPSSIISSDKIFDTIKSHELKAKSEVGIGTDFGAIIRPFVSGKFKGFVPDLMIVFTDGQFLDLTELESKNKSWYLENRDKILFVLTTDEYTDNLKFYDSSYLERTIIFKNS